MKFSEMNRKQLKEAREELQRRMRDSLHSSRVTGLMDTMVTLEGGTFPATFNNVTGELSIWGRGSRYSGGSMTVSQLEIAEAEVQKFYDDYQGGE